MCDTVGYGVAEHIGLEGLLGPRCWGGLAPAGRDRSRPQLLEPRRQQTDQVANVAERLVLAESSLTGTR
jgi:hypothetical protein